MMCNILLSNCFSKHKVEFQNEEVRNRIKKKKTYQIS